MHVPRLRRPGRRPRVVAALLAVLMAGAGGGAVAGTAQAADGAADRVLRPGVRGTALAWGANLNGQLGDGTTTFYRTTPDLVCGMAPCTDPLRDAIAISGGNNHTIALRADGTVVAWGYNITGQLGDGTSLDRTTPVRVCAVGATAPCTSFLSNVVSIAAGGDHSLALLADGTVVGWGSNGAGQLGNGASGTFNTTPVQTCEVSGCSAPLTHVVALAAGSAHSLALGTDGYVRAWGSDSDGQLGDGNTGTISPTPIFVSGVSGATAIAGGFYHSVAVQTGGTVMTWGSNSLGQLGDGTTTDRSTPVQVCAQGATAPCATFLTGIGQVAAGYGHTVALRTDGSVRSWGYNASGQLGNGTTTGTTTPVRVCAGGTTAPCGTFQDGITALAAAGGQTLALRFDGGVRAWGSNSFGLLGDGTTVDRTTPVRVCAIGQTAPCSRPLSGAIAVTTSSNNSAALVRS
ncbi:hypothetical protein [Kitasatospora sp. NPDC093806]|uniref:RCC1 domain-containing protein n=1 Tax=Kitasatospora sp. NPDC093806 TaxID=3155075 RepID=UPI0034432F79